VLQPGLAWAILNVEPAQCAAFPSPRPSDWVRVRRVSRVAAACSSI
jgi:hypothetical protein